MYETDVQRCVRGCSKTRNSISPRFVMLRSFDESPIYGVRLTISEPISVSTPSRIDICIHMWC